MLSRTVVKQAVTTVAALSRTVPRSLSFTTKRSFQTRSKTIQTPPFPTATPTTLTHNASLHHTCRTSTCLKQSYSQHKAQLNRTKRSFSTTTTTPPPPPEAPATTPPAVVADHYKSLKIDNEEAFAERLAEFRKGNYPREPNAEYWENFLPSSMDAKNKWEFRYPGTVKKLRHLAEIDSFPQNPDLGTDSIRITLHRKVLEQHAVERARLIASIEVGEINVTTGTGMTPGEYQKAMLQARADNAPKVTATNRIKREEFYDSGKKDGLYKRTWFNRVFNSTEDLLQARPTNKEYSQSEAAPVQPRSWLGLAMMSAFAAAGVLYIKYLDTQSYATATVVQYQTNGTLALGGDFDGLVDQFGKEANSEQYRGFYPLYYFGFTKCPDICPTELHKMMAALDTIERSQPDLYRFIKPVFITVDPLRDTPAQIAAYAENFHPRMRWLTGSHEALTKAAKEFHIYFSIPDDATPDGDYNVDHSIFFFLMNREGKLLSYYGQNRNSQEIAQAMAAVISEDLERDEYEASVNSRKSTTM